MPITKSMSNKSGSGGGGKSVKMPGSVKFGSKTCAGRSMAKKGRDIGEDPKFRKIVGG